MVCGLGTGTVALTPCAEVSTKATRSSPFTATSSHLPSAVMARPCGPLPTSMARVTRSLVASISLTAEALEPLTNTLRPSGVRTMPSGPAATGSVATTRSEAVSITLTVLSLKLPT